MPGNMDGADKKWPSAYQTCRDKTRVYSATTACRHQSRASLFVIRGDRLGACLTPGDTPATVGRSADVDFQIADSQVSRRHCQFYLEGQSLWLRDLGSTNGTFVNDSPVSQRVQLRDGDHIRIAGTILKCVVESSHEARYHHAMYEGLVRDALTGLHNRRFAMDVLAKETARAKRDFNYEFSVLILDLDHFKQINDRYGHLNGDIVLREVAQVLEKRIRDSDTLARIGGEEFLVLLPDTGYRQAFAIAETLRSGIESCCSRIAMHAPGTDSPVTEAVTLSAGVAAWEQKMKSAGDLLHVADSRLYEAKSAGRNRIA